MEGLTNQVHLSDEELLDGFYAGSLPGEHLNRCAECRARLKDLSGQRLALETDYRPEDELGFDFLAAQRRRIYTRIDQRQSGGWFVGVRRWATAAGVIVAIGGGLAVVEQQHRSQLERERLSDAQLVADVSQFAASSEPQPAAPLRALFAE
jgi:hypothetical protein